MSEPSLADKVEAVHHALTNAGINHAFGGALALAYYAEPRATADIDLNLFIASSRHARVADALRALGVDPSLDPERLRQDNQGRIRWGRTPIDIFYAYDPFHRAMHRGLRAVPFGPIDIPILAPEHLVVCKALFDRPRDWVDIQSVVAAGTRLKRAEARTWIRRIAGPDDPRATRLVAALAPPPSR